MPLNQNQIIKLLEERGANAPCNRCGKNNFTLVDKYTSFPLQDELDGTLRIGGPNIPVALVICTNCGAIAIHALGALGLLTAQKEEQDANK